MIKWLLSFIPVVGPFLSAMVGSGGNVLNAVANYFQQKASTELAKYQTGVTADTQVALAMVNAQVETNKLITQQAIADKGWGPTAWMKPVAFYCFMIHVGAIVLDSTFHLNWQIAKLPEPYPFIEQAVILTCVGVVGLKSIARTFTKTVV